MAWEKREVYVLTVYLGEENEDGESMDCLSDSEEYFADTLEEAEKMKEKFLNGEDEFYGDSIKDCIISDEKEEREFLVRKRSRLRTSRMSSMRTGRTHG